MTFVHGMGVDGRMWVNILPHLGEGYQLINPDLPGFGFTPPIDFTGGRPLDLTARWLAGEIKRSGAEKTTLVGYSMGAMLAVITALDNPGLVEGLVLIAGDVNWGRGARKWFSPLAGIASRFLMGRAYREIARLTGDKQLTALVKDMIDRADPAVTEALLKDMLTTDLSARLGEINCPALIIGGERDVQATLRGVRELHRGIRGSRLVTFPGAGHYLLINREREAVELLAQFMGKDNGT